MFRFIHCCDWHLPVPAREVTGAWRLKQILGRLSWRISRHRRHRRDVLDAAVRVWCEPGVDRVCVTGDLVNFAVPAEYGAAAEYLRRIEAKSAVSVIPGNHDALVPGGLIEQRRHWERWLGAGSDAQPWPSVAIHGPVAFVGLSSAIPTPPFLAQGAVAPSQLAALKQLLPSLAQSGLFRVVMVHHPPQAGAIGRRKALRNGPELREVLRQGGAELVLHGHLHHPSRAWLAGDSGPIPVLGAGSASLWGMSGPASRGHFALINVEASTGGGWRLFVTDYFFDPERNAFEPCEPGEIVPPHSSRPHGSIT